MDEGKAISATLSSIFRILQLFRNLSDSYVVEFFVNDLWSRLLPDQWREFFDQIDLCGLGAFLDLEHSLTIGPMNIVPPLSLLCLRRCSQVYSIGRSPPIPPKDILAYFGINSDQSRHTENIDHRLMARNPPASSLLHMNPKKKHEIVLLADLIDLLTMERRNRLKSNSDEISIIDVGSGCGHLARYLSFVKEIKMTTVESQSDFIERAKSIDQKIAWRLRKWNENGFNFPVHRNEYFSNPALENLDSDQPPGPIWLLGLHTCGDLASAILKTFNLDPKVELLLSISCCYMKLTTELDSTSQCKSIGYPMSNFLQQLNWHELSYPAREMSCHALEQHSAKLRYSSDDDLEILKVHGYRAALELLIISKYPHRKRGQIRSVKNAHTMTLREYCERALSRLNGIDMEKILEEKEMELWTEKVEREWKRAVIFYSIRLILAPLIESAILLDRLLYLKECGYGKSMVVPIFDPNISARNFLLMAWKGWSGS